MHTIHQHLKILCFLLQECTIVSFVNIRSKIFSIDCRILFCNEVIESCLIPWKYICDGINLSWARATLISYCRMFSMIVDVMIIGIFVLNENDIIRNLPPTLYVNQHRKIGYFLLSYYWKIYVQYFLGTWSQLNARK